MFKDIATNEYMYPILDFDNYSVSRSGKVGRSHRVRGNAEKYQRYTRIAPYMRHGILCVKLENNEGVRKELSVAKLVMNSRYGELPFKIRYRNGDRSNVTQDNLEYIFSTAKIQNGIQLNDVYYPGRILILSDDDGNFEVFKPVPDSYLYNNEKYWVSSKGAVYNSHGKYLVSRSNTDNGYYKITFEMPGRVVDDNYIGPRWVYPKIHTLTYASWVDPDLKGWTVDHVDGRRHNNDIFNLEKVTFRENLHRAHERNLGYDEVIRSKWRVKEIELVCKLLSERKTYKEIAEALGIDASDKTTKEYKSVANLCIAIRDGRVHQEIARNYDIPNNTDVTWKTDYKTPTKYDPEIIRAICRSFVDGMSPKEVIAKYGDQVNSGTIYNIKIGKQYRDLAETVPGMLNIINSRMRHSEYAVENGLDAPPFRTRAEQKRISRAKRKALGLPVT